jgi:DNA-binding FadR family transcriptional regulator
MEEAAKTAISNIVVQKASDVLASRLRQLILSGELKPGDALPNERELVAQSGLGRSSVREALRVLSAEGLIATRGGRGGGSMVTLPDRDSIRRPVELFIRTNELSFDSLLDCRMAVEPMLARLAAVNRTDAEAETLQALQEEFASKVNDLDAYRRINLEWHLAIARASNNPPLIALMEAISSPILASSRPSYSTTEKIRRETVKIHARIQAAIMQQDGDAAFRLMAQHVGAFQSLSRERAQSDEQRAVSVG